ncbi:MAG TPA: SBBP repeat-containing protein [Candidatus Acidoferrales bacterium]|jgi:hypothetical protein|nr:SBBP repeat-containing protein [Candidatus Acidoferrales bacterium]
MGQSWKSKWALALCALIGVGAISVGLAARGIREPNGKSSKASTGGNKAAKAASKASAAAPAQLVAHYSRLPLAFEPAAPEQGSQFLAHGKNYTIYLNQNATMLALRGAKGAGVVQMKLAGARRAEDFTPSNELPGKSNYILGNQPEKWRTNVPNYAKLTQYGVYPGIDVVYYGTQRELEYDFVVGAHANPAAVRIDFDGARRLRTDAKGDLVVGIAGGDVRLHKPVAYQEIAGKSHIVAANYVVRGKHEASFEVGDYDPSKTLIIDPVLSYSTYLGGSNIDGANAIAVAPDATAFIAGGTFSSDFPTAHALQPNHGGPDDFSQDAFVTKISADGSTLLYSTYLGGKSEDVANGIAVDPFGEAYITGSTLSPDFPVTPLAWAPLCGGDGKCGATWNPLGLIVSNAFVTKLNVAGSGIIYSTYLGSYEHVRGQAIAVDANQNAYVTGSVEQDLIPTVPITAPNQPPPPFLPPALAATAFQPTFGGGTTDSFIAKFSATGSSVSYLSYLGGLNEEIGYGIAADNNGVAYLTGLTYSGNFPTKGALQGAYGGAGDAFVTQVNTTAAGAASLIFSTYLGGNGLDQGNAIALDAAGGTGNIYVTGTTNGGALPASPSQYAGQGDAFVLKLTSTDVLTYFRLLGGSLADAGLGIAADPQGNAYVTGSTVSPDFPIAATVFQKTFGGGNADAFVTKVDPTGATLLYSTYLGGTNTDVGNGIAVEANGSAYVAGQTCSTDFPLANPEQPGPGGNCDAFVSKVSTIGGIAVNPAGLVFPAQSIGVTSQQQSVTITNTNDTGSVSISGITVTGANAGDFVQTNNCPATLTAGATCNIFVTFHPTVAGVRKGSISVTDNATGSPQVINLTGSTSTITLSASSLTFGTQTVGLASTPQAVTLTNIGTTSLTISSITGSGDFSQTNTCGTSLPGGANCVISVTYKPAAPGQSLGAITISDNAPGSPQSILLTGTGVGQLTDFALAAQPPTSTVPAGKTATYTLTLTPVGGFSSNVGLTCSGLPAGATCSFSANPATTSGAPMTVTLNVITALRTVAPLGFERMGPGTPWNAQRMTLVAIGLMLGLLLIVQLRRRPAIAAFGLAAALLLVSAGCGGGSQSGTPAGTPAGSYQIAVTGTSGSLTHSVTLALQVQ